MWKSAVLLMLLSTSIVAQESEQMGDTSSDNNQDGSLNTNTVGSTVSSNNVSVDESKTTNYQGANNSGMPVGSAIAPSYMSNGMETCLQGSGGSIQTGLIGITKGSYQADVDCNRRRDSKLLSDLGMKVAAIALMCSDIKVWRSLFISATPCPILIKGKLIVGKRAFLVMKSEPSLHIPDYGEVKVKRAATWSKKPPIPIYTKTQLYYNQILGIGAKENEIEIEDSGSTLSVSEQFRSSVE